MERYNRIYKEQTGKDEVDITKVDPKELEKSQQVIKKEVERLKRTMPKESVGFTRYKPLFSEMAWGTNLSVIQNFIESENPLEKGKATQTKNIILKPYGSAVGLINYSTLIALKVPAGKDFIKPFKVIMNTSDYSTTTRRIKSYIKRQAETNNYVIEEMSPEELKAEANAWEEGKSVGPEWPKEFGEISK